MATIPLNGPEPSRSRARRRGRRTLMILLASLSLAVAGTSAAGAASGLSGAVSPDARTTEVIGAVARHTGYPSWPSPENTGPRTAPTSTRSSVTSSRNGQVISGITVNGRLTIKHDNVTVRDVIVNGRGTYMIQVVPTSSGRCPSNVRIVYTEINGANASESDIPLYSPRCGYTFDHGHIHNVGRASRVVNNTTISNSYIFSNRTGSSGSHRGAVGINGGSNNRIINNVLLCRGTGCSAAIPMYGDFGPVNGLLVQHNLLATTGSYCAYGGSLDSKPYPNGSGIQFIDNHFSTRYFSTCGRYGAVSGFEEGERSNVWRGNVWHESYRPVVPGGVAGTSGDVYRTGDYTLAAGRTITGDLTVKNGTVTIHGRVAGNITHIGSGMIVIASRGDVGGDVSEQGPYGVIVDGHIDGSLNEYGSGGIRIGGSVDGHVYENDIGNVVVTSSGDVDLNVVERWTGDMRIEGDVGRIVSEGGSGYVVLGSTAVARSDVREHSDGNLYTYRGAYVGGSIVESGSGSRIRR